jgi:hypothetical protein
MSPHTQQLVVTGWAFSHQCQGQYDAWGVMAAAAQCNCQYGLFEPRLDMNMNTFFVHFCTESDDATLRKKSKKREEVA